MGNRLWRAAAWMPVVLALSVSPGESATVYFQTDAQMIASATRVVLGRVVGQRFVKDGDADETVHTVTRIAVLEDFTGVSPGEIEVWELGGVSGETVVQVEGAVRFRQGEEVVLILEDGPHGFRSVAMNLSAFHVQRNPDGSAILVRDLRQTQVLGGSPSSQSLTAFRKLAAQVTGRGSVLRDPALALPTADQAFTFVPFGPPRWIEADSGIPIKIYMNTQAPAPVSGDSVPEIMAGAAAWTNPPSASIILQYAGLTFQTDPRTLSGISGPGILITYEDPNNELSSATLAIAGGNYEPGGGGVVNGVPFFGFKSAYVIFQKKAKIPATYKTTINFTRLMGHELGHTIGLGHTQEDGSVVNPQDNLMLATCCAASTPTPPAIGPDDVAGLQFIYPIVTTTIVIDKDHLNYGATMISTDFIAQTTAQIIRMTQIGPGTVTWTATSSVPWLQISPASGTGPQPLSLTVNTTPGLPLPGTVTGTVTINFNGALPSTRTVAILLKTIVHGTSTAPYGTMDTPLPGSTGLTGAIPVTGWSIDDTEVTNVALCRDGWGLESPAADARCLGNRQIFLGYVVFVDGARTDIDGIYPTWPRSTRGGWGYMVLTNMLPNQGNGNYRISAYALDNEGYTTHLGSRTFNCANATATKPFGTIDTPFQGEVIAGNAFYNWGWALTQQPKYIPTDGSTLGVYIDGAFLARPAAYNLYRDDVSGYFPGLANTNGPLGYYVLDTTAFSNGVHTIAWVATDSGGFAEGLGSRYFTVANPYVTAVRSTSAAVTALPRPLTPDEVDALPPDSSPLPGRRGWKEDRRLRDYTADSSGLTVVRGEELDRFELIVPATSNGTFSGFLRVGSRLDPLPAGSVLDASSGHFTWAPGVGFVGTYQLVFVESLGGVPVSRREVRIILAPKGSMNAGAQVVIDAPTPQQAVGQPFVLAGWAADFDAERGTGVDAIHVWAYPVRGGGPQFVGIATLGGERPDVAAMSGEQFRNAGYGLYVQGLASGQYDLAVFGHSAVTGDFVAATVVRVTVR